MYFSLVAIPPRMCRSALFFCNTVFTLCARFGEIIDSRFVTSICTVDLLMPNTAAVCLTVELFLTIYSPSSIHLFSTISFIKITIAFQATNQILSTATGVFEQRNFLYCSFCNLYELVVFSITQFCVDRLHNK